MRNRVGALAVEVKDAIARGRDAPRKDPYGLPNVRQDLLVSMTLEGHEIVRKAMEKAAREIAGVEEGKRPTEEEAMVHLARRFLETASRGAPAEESARSRVAFNVVYVAYKPTREGYVLTEEGPVEVPWDHIARIEGEARKVELTLNDLVKGEALPPGKIDRAIPAGVEMKVLLDSRQSTVDSRQ
jgi:hypothetical protein